MLESTFRRQYVDPYLIYLQRNFPAYFMSIQQQSLSGDADKLGVINGKFIGLELKRDGEEPTPLQYFKLEKIKRAGGVALWTCPLRWADTKELLLKIAKEAL